MADKPREIAFFKAVAFFILSLLFLAPDDLSGAESFSYVNHPPAEVASLFSTNSYNLVPVLLPDFFYVKSLTATLFPGARAPRLSCPDDISTYTDINTCTSYITGGLNPEFDPAEAVTLTWEMEGATVDASPPRGINLIDDYTFNEGATIVTYTITGAGGTTAECSFTITISDNQVPRLEGMPGNISVVAAPGQCSAPVHWTEPSVSDNCTPSYFIRRESTARPGDEFPVGTTRVYYAAYDAMGNESAVRSFTVTVEDREPPVLILPPGMTVECGQPLPAPWRSWQQAVAAGGNLHDNCGLNEESFALLSETQTAETCPYTLIRTYTIADASGNSTTAEHRIAVTGKAGEAPPPVEEPRLKGAMAGTTTAINNGNWNDPATWDNGVPDEATDAVIPGNFVVTIDDAAECKDITIQSGGTLNHSSATTLQVNGNWANNGIYTGGTGTIEFTGGNSATIGGNSTTLFVKFTLNKTSDAIALQITGDVKVDGDLIGDVLFTSGTLEIVSGGSIDFVGNAGFTIGNNAGIFVNGGTFSTGSFSVENNGLFRVDSGTASFGAVSGNSFTIRSSGTLDVNGGTIQIAGRLVVSGGKVDISNGTINLNTVGHSSSSLATLNLTATSGFNMTGGTINFLQPNGSGNLDLSILSGGDKTFGGTLNFGNGSPATFKIYSEIPFPNISTENNTELVFERSITSSGDYTFPIVGGSGNSIPVTLTFNGVTSSGSITVSTYASSGSIPTGLSTTSFLDRHWVITSSGFSFSDYSATFNYSETDLEGGATAGDLRFYHTDGSSYTSFPDVSTSTNSFTLSGLITFGEFGAAECGVITISAATNNPVMVSCNGGSDGAIAINISGGVTPLSYSWTGPGSFTSTDKDISGLAAGIYEVKVTDAAGCEGTSSFGITEPAELTASAVQDNPVVCNGKANGEATVTVSGGTAPYSYSWDKSSSTSATASDLAAGEHAIIVTDDNGCQTTALVTITEPDELTANAVQNNPVACNGEANGEATVTVSGGTSPYSYSWDKSASTSATADDLVVGEHNITITDANDCQTTAQVIIDEPDELLIINLGSNSPVCEGEILNLTSSATGGTPEYTYSWTGPNGYSSSSANPTITNATPAASGTYTLTVTDDNGCTDEKTVEVTVNPLPTATISGDDELCVGESATITVNFTGTAPFTFEINDGDEIITSSNSYSISVNPVITTSYLVTSLTDAYCEAGENELVGEATIIVNWVDGGEIAEDQHICFGEQPATISSTSDGTGEGTISYRWERSSEPFTNWTTIASANSSTYSPSPNQYYTYKYRRLTVSTLTSGKECQEYSNEILITVQDLVTAGSIAGAQTICSGDIPNPITSSEAGTSGSATIEYEWQQSTDGGNTWQDISGNSADYTFTTPVTQTTLIRRRTKATVTGNTPCFSEYTQPVTITIIPPPTPGMIGGTQTICYNTLPATIPSMQNGTSPGSAIKYKWEYSTNNGNTWIEIPGAESSSYAPTSQLTQTTWFRRITLATQNGKTCQSVPTEPTIVTVQLEVDPGSISSSQTICYDNSPNPLVSDEDASGSATPAYQWEYSIDNGTTWFTISGATNEGYSPGKLTQTTSFRRIANITLNGRTCSAISSPVEINVLDEIIPPDLSADQEICYNTQPNPLGFTSTGNYNYQWQRSTDNVNFYDISGVTGETYQPGNLTDTTYYRIKTTLENCDPKYSNTVEIVVWPQVIQPTICCSVFRCILNDAPPITITNPPGGFGPNVTYQWQRGARILWWWDDWGNINGATSEIYIPTEVILRYQYRLLITDNCTGNTFTSNTVEVTPALSLSGNLSQSISPEGSYCPEEQFTYRIESGSIDGLFGRTIRYEWEADPEFISPASGGPEYSQNGSWGFYTEIDFTTHNETNDTVTTTITVYPKVYNSNGTVACELEAETVDITILPFKINCPQNMPNVSTDEGKCYATVTPEYPEILCNYTSVSWMAEGATEITETSGFVENQQFNKGLTTVTYTVENNAGVEKTCSFTINVTDDEDPIITCPGEIITDNDLDFCSAYIEYEMPEVTDNCGSYTIQQTAGLPSGSYFDVGTTTNTFVATDAAGNTSTCSFDVTVNDVQKPAFTLCPSNIIQPTDIASCSKSITPPPPDFYENCNGTDFQLTWEMNFEGTITSGNDLLQETEFEIGTTTITYRLTDADGVLDECTFTITITDNNQPELSCFEEDQTRNTDQGQCSYTAQNNEFDPLTASVLCKTFTLTNNLNENNTLNGYVFPVGTTLVQWTIVDEMNQAKTCSFNVVVTDNEDPVITACPADLTGDDVVEGCNTGALESATGFAYSETEVELSDPADFPGTATDNCGIVKVVYQDASTGACPTIVTRTWTVSDAENNSDNCQQIIHIDDTTKPNFTFCPTPPQNNTFEVIVNSGNTYIHDNSEENWDATAEDNCGTVSSLTVMLSGDTQSGPHTTLDGVTFNEGTTTVTWTATDACGNTDDCTFDVEVIGQADIAVTKALTSHEGVGPIAAGDEVIYTITVTNNGPATAGTVTLTDVVPAAIENPQYTVNGGTSSSWPASNELVFNDMSAGSEQVIVITGTAGCPPVLPEGETATITNTATVALAAPLTDPDTDNNTATVETDFIDNTPPTFSDNPPDFTECVENLSSVIFNGDADNLKYNPNYPEFFPAGNGNIPGEGDGGDYYIFVPSEDSRLDLDLTQIGYSDNCCGTDVGDIEWTIDFDGTEDDVTGTGQPSTYGNNIYLWGDGVNYQERNHTITYFIYDCHGNKSSEIVRQIVIQPRPKITKVP